MEIKREGVFPATSLLQKRRLEEIFYAVFALVCLYPVFILSYLFLIQGLNSSLCTL